MKKDVSDKLDLDDKLAINYVNVSASKENWDYNKGSSIGNLKSFFEKGYRDNYKDEDFAYARTILILGNGASYGLTESATKIIEQIEDSLRYGSSNLGAGVEDEKALEYRKRAEHTIEFQGKSFPMEIPIDELKKQLSFESRLSILVQIFKDKRDVVKELQAQVNKKYLPSALYEIVAHMFKHRFIDVIVNFNFDELLDNALEDELGERTYLRVVHDSDIIPFKNVCDNRRLKTPIYIKPHGTVSSRSSMLFTKEQYMKDMSLDMHHFLGEIFGGSVGEQEASKEQRIKRLNILIAGFGMESIEFNRLLFKKLCTNKRPQEVSYYIFDYDPEGIKDKIRKQGEKYSNRPLNWEYISFPCTASKKISDYFNHTYEKVQKLFDKPYVPQKALRHRLLLQFFPENKTEELDPGHELDEFYDYLEKRVKFNLLYDLLKFKGCFATNVAIGSRAGKYYQYLLKLKHQHNDTYKKTLLSLLMDCLKEEGDLDDLVRISDVAYLYKPFQRERVNKYEKRYRDRTDQEKDSDDRREEEQRTKIIKHIIRNCSIVSLNENDLKLHEDFSSVYNTGLNEINPLYTDPKLGRFYQFKKDQVIPTNLGFSFKFFQFAVKNSDKWDELWFADDTGTAIYNLNRYDTTTESGYRHLSKLIADGKIIHLQTINEKKIIEGNIQQDIVTAIKGWFKEQNKEDNFIPRQLDINDSFHHMALFLKNKENGPRPVYGIYFFKPGTKNRINPVYFECEKGVSDKRGWCNDRKNLIEMMELFSLQVKVSSSEQVNTFIDGLPPAQQELVRLLREIILATDPAISEHIKWNAPAFYYNGAMAAFDAKTYKRDILVMNLRQKDHLLLIFPTGDTIADSSGLLEGDYADGRRMVRINDLADARAKKAALQALIKTWLAQVE